MAIKKEELKSGCISRAAADEPVFVLRAKDRLAPGVIRYWTQRAANMGVSPAKIEEALDLAAAMEEWQEAHGCKLPD